MNIIMDYMMIISILFIVVLGLGLTGVGGYQQKKNK